LETIAYTVLVQIGKGSFATCWKCHNTTSDELVAIKVIDKSAVKFTSKLEAQL
jgi:serine/threonine protein kinase